MKTPYARLLIIFSFAFFTPLIFAATTFEENQDIDDRFIEELLNEETEDKKIEDEEKFDVDFDVDAALVELGVISNKYEKSDKQKPKKKKKKKKKKIDELEDYKVSGWALYSGRSSALILGCYNVNINLTFENKTGKRKKRKINLKIKTGGLDVGICYTAGLVFFVGSDFTIAELEKNKIKLGTGGYIYTSALPILAKKKILPLLPLALYAPFENANGGIFFMPLINLSTMSILLFFCRVSKLLCFGPGATTHLAGIVRGGSLKLAD